MACKHRKVKGGTTKYFYCSIFNKSVDNYKCNNCLMKIESEGEQLNRLFSQIFGQGFNGGNS